MREALTRLGVDERRLLLGCLDLRGRALEANAQAIDWHALIAVARATHVLPTVASRVLGARLELPPEIEAALRESLEATAIHNTRLLSELARLSERLRAEGIAHVALKGAVLMARCYASPALRHAVDLDLLVDPERFEQAVALLRAGGCTEPAYTQTLAFDGRSWARALGAAHLHAATPLQTPSGVIVDLHRRVPVTSFERQGGFAGWHVRARVVAPHGIDVPTTCDDDLARHLCEHFALQNHGDPLDAPRLLCDLRVLFADAPPWQRLAPATAPWRARAAIGVVRALYEAAFHASPAPPLRVRQLQRVAVPDPALTSAFSELAALRRYADRFAADLVHRPAFAAAKLMPSSAYMTERYGLAASSRRVYARYARRLAAVVVRPLRP
jgi:hypothetical protein